MGLNDLINSSVTQTKCGEIILLDNIKFLFVCTLCDEPFYSVMFFRNHLKREHKAFNKIIPCMEEKGENLLDEPPTQGQVRIEWNKNVSNENSNDETNINSCSNFVLNEEEELDDKDFQDTFIDEIFIEEILLTQENNVSNDFKYEQDEDVESNHELKDLFPTASNKVITRSRNKNSISKDNCQTNKYEPGKIKERDRHNETRDNIKQNGTKGKCSTSKNLSANVPKDQHKCDECGKCFKNKYRLRDHLVIHSGTHPYKCDVCDASFSHRNNLKTHSYLHTGYRPHQCKQCDKGYVTSSALRIHLRKHTNERPFVCQLCKSSFASKPPYHRHLLTHSGERPYKCTQCEKAFSQKDRLNRHMISHSNEKKFVCEICSKEFNHKKNLTQHQKLHLKTKQYICKVCSKDFAQYAGLHSHMKFHKNKE